MAIMVAIWILDQNDLNYYYYNLVRKDYVHNFLQTTSPLKLLYYGGHFG